MKMKLILLFAIMLGFFPLRLPAQTRVLVGFGGGSLYGNTTATVLGTIEKPVASKFELALRDEFSPYDAKVLLGTGTANLVRGTGLLWLSKSTGLVGNFEYSEYTTQIHKGMYHVMPGIMFRFDGPTRLEFDYIRQVNNQMSHGVESNYFQGGRVAVSTRLSCSGSVCYHLAWEIDGGRALAQSNPLCDGSLGGPITCARTAGLTGGAKVSFQIEFPRRRNTDYDVF